MVDFPEETWSFNMHLKKKKTEGDMNSVEEIQLIPEQMIAIYNKKWSQESHLNLRVV